MDFDRQRNLTNMDGLMSVKVLVVGAGGIGSHTVDVLTKMGIEHLEVWDFDTVDKVNIPVQSFNFNQEGHKKVEALADNVIQRTGTFINPKDSKWDGTDFSFNPEIIITGVDCINIRKDIWKGMKESGEFIGKHRWLIDARMAADVSEVNVVYGNDPDSIKYYEEQRISINKEDIAPAPCGMKAIGFNSLKCASNICGTIHNIINRHPVRYKIHEDTIPGLVFDPYVSKTPEQIKSHI